MRFTSHPKSSSFVQNLCIVKSCYSCQALIMGGRPPLGLILRRMAQCVLHIITVQGNPPSMTPEAHHQPLRRCTSPHLTAGHGISISKTTRSMRPTLRMAASMAAQSSSLKPAAMNLLPPIPLYRRLLRAHRKHLPHEMRVLGDEYVKAEFRAHRNVDNPVHLVGRKLSWVWGECVRRLH